jgi:type II restriction/modification system DNA methylase subunit YeeA
MARLLCLLRIGRDVEGREAQARIKREFEDSMAKLKSLLARIEGTDRLIDQIVYRLYGLTEEEIAVVEGLNR